MKSAKIYTWQAYDMDFNQYQGEMQSGSKLEVKRTLISQGLMPVHIKMVARFSFERNLLEIRSLFTHQLAVMLNSGVPLLNSLQLLANGMPQAHWRYLLTQLQQEISKGLAFSQALKQYPAVFPSLFCEIIHMGELTGTLEQSCSRLAKQQSKSIRLRRSIKKALRYPVFILLITLLVTLLMLIFVLPEFTAIYDNFEAKLPAFTLLFISLSDSIRHYGWGFVMVVLFSLLFYRYLRHTRPGYIKKEQQLFLAIPVVRQLIQQACLARFFSTLSLTQRAGIPLTDGLSAAVNVVYYDNYQQVILSVKRKIEEGFSFYQSVVKETLFTDLSKQLIQVGEESGALDDMLEQLAVIYEQQTETQAEKLTQMLEPVLMSVLAIIVGSLVIAMYLPIFQLGNIMS